MVQGPKESLEPESAAKAPADPGSPPPLGSVASAPPTSAQPSGAAVPGGSERAVSPPAPGVPTKFCFACGSQLDARAEICPRCGVRQMPPPGMHIDPLGRSRVVAALLGIFLGAFGIHKFYLGKMAQGVIYVVFFWTFIPAIIGFIEGIWYLTMSDQEFQGRYPR